MLWKYDKGSQFPIEVLQTDYRKLNDVSHILNKRIIKITSLILVDGIADGSWMLYNDGECIF